MSITTERTRMVTVGTGRNVGTWFTDIEHDTDLFD